MNTKVDNLGKSVTVQSSGQSPAESSAPDSGYVLEPDSQVSIPSRTEEPDTKTKDGLEAENSPQNSENPATAPEDISFETGAPNESASKDGGNELGGGAPIDDGEYLGTAGADGQGTDSPDKGGIDANGNSTATDKELATNPQMGYADDEMPDHTHNPSTGS